MIGIDTFSWYKLFTLRAERWKALIDEILEKTNIFITREVKKELGRKLDQAVAQNVKDGKVRTYDPGGTNKTTEVAGDIARIFEGLIKQ